MKNELKEKRAEIIISEAVTELPGAGVVISLRTLLDRLNDKVSSSDDEIYLRLLRSSDAKCSQAHSADSHTAGDNVH